MDEFKNIIRIANEMLNQNDSAANREPDKNYNLGARSQEQSSFNEETIQFSDNNHSSQDSASFGHMSIEYSRLHPHSPHSNKSIKQLHLHKSPGSISKQTLSEAVQIIQGQVRQKRIDSLIKDMMNSEAYDNLKKHPIEIDNP